MKSQTASWVAVATETELYAWSRETGAVASAPRPISGGMRAVWSVLRPLLPAQRGAMGILLSSDVYTQTLRLPERQTARLPEAELRNLLAFETEPFSQIAPSAALLAYAAGGTDVSGTRSWDIAEFPREDAALLLRAAKADRLRLSGIAALPEAWGHATPDSPEAAALLASLADAPPTLLISANAVFGVDAKSGSAKGSLRQNALAAALIFTFAAYLLLGNFARAAQRKTRELESSAQRVAVLQQQVQSIRHQIDEIRGAGQRAEVAERKLERYRGAWSSLLDGLTKACEGGVVVQSISATGPFAVRVEAYCANPDEPTRAMEQFAMSTAEAGWIVQPGALQSGTSPGVTRFSFTAEMAP